MPFKDTPDGQTHYQNDGCGEPAHNDITKDTKKEGWEEELDKKFGHIQIFKEWESRGESYGGIKQFIRPILAQSRLEGRNDAYKRAAEIVNGMKKKGCVSQDDNGIIEGYLSSSEKGYNKACEDIASAIEALSSDKE